MTAKPPNGVRLGEPNSTSPRIRKRDLQGGGRRDSMDSAAEMDTNRQLTAEKHELDAPDSSRESVETLSSKQYEGGLQRRPGDGKVNLSKGAGANSPFGQSTPN